SAPRSSMLSATTSDQLWSRMLASTARKRATPVSLFDMHAKYADVVPSSYVLNTSMVLPTICSPICHRDEARADLSFAVRSLIHARRLAGPLQLGTRPDLIEQQHLSALTA